MGLFVLGEGWEPRVCAPNITTLLKASSALLDLVLRGLQWCSLDVTCHFCYKRLHPHNIEALL